MDIVDVFFYVLIISIVVQLVLQFKLARTISKEFKFLEHTLSGDIYKVKSQINQHTSTINADTEKRLKAHSSSLVGSQNKFVADRINGQNVFITKKIAEVKTRMADEERDDQRVKAKARKATKK